MKKKATVLIASIMAFCGINTAQDFLYSFDLFTALRVSP